MMMWSFMKRKVELLNPNVRDREPNTARKNAQIKQRIRDSLCIHNSTRILILECGGYAEYCIDCFKMISLWENDR